MTQGVPLSGLYPQYVVFAACLIERASKDEQQIGEPVKVFAREFGDLFIIAQMHDSPFDTPAYRTCEMCKRGGPRASGKDEILKWREALVELSGEIFQPGDVRFADDDSARNADFPAKIEEIILDVPQRGMDIFCQSFGQQHADDGVEFVDFTDAIDAQTIFADAAAVSQSGSPGVAGAGNDFAQTFAHDAHLKKND